MSENLAILFKCGSCENDSFERVTENVTVLREVAFVDFSGYVDYDEHSRRSGNGDVSHFQCLACGFAIRAADGEYAQECDLAEVLTEMGVTLPKPVHVDSLPGRRAALAAALETPGDLTPEELEQAKSEIVEILLGAD